MWVTRPYLRRRHRSWMMSMTLASLGWGTWWCLLFVHRLTGARPNLLVPSVISSTFALLGLLFVAWSFRAHRAWVMLLAVPFLANLSLLFVPWFAQEFARKPAP
jgi:hypothetical protein